MLVRVSPAYAPATLGITGAQFTGQVWLLRYQVALAPVRQVYDAEPIHAVQSAAVVVGPAVVEVVVDPLVVVGAAVVVGPGVVVVDRQGVSSRSQFSTQFIAGS